MGSPCGSGGSRDALACFACSDSARRSALLFGSPSAPVDGGRSGPQGRAHEVRAFADSARMRCRRTPADVHAPAGQDARRAVLRGVVSLGDFSLDKHCAAGAARTAKLARRAEGRMPGVKRSYRPAGMRDEPTGMWPGFREAVGAGEHERNDTAKAPSPCPLPQAGEGKANAGPRQIGCGTNLQRCGGSSRCRNRKTKPSPAIRTSAIPP